MAPRTSTSPSRSRSRSRTAAAGAKPPVPRRSRPRRGAEAAKGPQIQAVRFHRPKSVSVEDVPAPAIEDPRDVVLRITSTSICGSDLHIYNGLLPQARPMTLGHEFMGVVEEVGSHVRKLRPGQRVIVPFLIADGTCWFCAKGLPSACESTNAANYGPEGGMLKEKGGALFGYTDLYGGYEGGQAERVRVPHADFNCRVVPEDLGDEQVLFLTDVFPTGWQAMEWADVQEADTVAVFGCGPVGIMAQKAARLRGAREVIGIDLLDDRLALARKAGGCTPVHAGREDAIERVRELTGGRGADVVVDAVGMEADRSLLEKASAIAHGQRGSMKVLRDCFSAARRGGRVSVLGVYGTTYDNFPLHQAFDKGLRIQGGQALVHQHVDHLLGLVERGEVRLDDIITHRMRLEEASRAYGLFNDKEDGCLKVVLKPNGSS